jgi:anti-anti-sigma factor
MNIKRTKNAIEIAGDIIFENVSEGHKRLKKDLESLDFTKPIRLDLGQVKEVDSSGLQIMLSFFEEVVRRKGKLEMVSISDSLNETIALAGLKRQFGL